MARAAIVAALLLVFAPASPVGADSWPGPRVVSVFSESGDRFVRIVPGASVGDTVGFAGAPRGAYARGESYARRPDRSYRLVADVALANPVAPVEALVSNGGHLLTLDNWHNLGHGPVVAVYGPAGSLLRSYRLEDLYDAKRLGGTLVVTLATAAIAYQPGAASCPAAGAPVSTTGPPLAAARPRAR